MAKETNYNEFAQKLELSKIYTQNYKNAVGVLEDEGVVVSANNLIAFSRVVGLMENSTFANDSPQIKMFVEKTATFDALSGGGVYEVTIVATGEDSCEHCKSMNGKSFNIFEEASLPPFHPNCKCTIVPKGTIAVVSKSVEIDNPYSFLGVSNNDYKALLSGILTKDDLLSISQSTALFDSANSQKNYYYMNNAHEQLVKIRQKYDNNYSENDLYDKTHNGRFNPYAQLPTPNAPPFKMPTFLYTKSHNDILEATQSLKPKKGTDEWDTLQFANWFVDYSLKGGKYEKIEPFKDQWVEGYSETIKAAAKKYDIPPELLAGVVHNEVGGDPLWVDSGAYKARELGFEVKGQAIKEKTSFGNTSVQVLTAATTLGYNLDKLTENEKDSIIKSLMDAEQGIYITALHLSQLRDYDFKGTGGKDLTEYEMSVIASRYNRGVSDVLDELYLGYGNDVILKLEKLKQLLRNK